MADRLSRRDLLKTASAVGAAVAVSNVEHVQGEPSHHIAQTTAAEPTATPVPVDQGVLFFFNDIEAKFIEAAVERLIPSEPEWPGAAPAGVLYFIDRQLAGAYGAGARMYLKGPWAPGAPPQQGYQLRYTPAELYRIGIAETLAFVKSTHSNHAFWDLQPSVMDEVLSALESGTAKLSSIPSPTFFETLLANTIEGYFADPAYGGNRDMVAWRMIGFPGAYAQYLDLVELYNLPYTRPPISIANTAARLEHIHSHK